MLLPDLRSSHFPNNSIEVRHMTNYLAPVFFFLPQINTPLPSTNLATQLLELIISENLDFSPARTSASHAHGFPYSTPFPITTLSPKLPFQALTVSSSSIPFLGNSLKTITPKILRNSQRVEKPLTLLCFHWLSFPHVIASFLD